MQTIHEYVGNMHVHSVYSDGELTHAEIAEAAIKAGLDFVIVTDHNVLVEGVEGYYGDRPDRRVLLLASEEIHDPRLESRGNHMLVYGAGGEIAAYAPDPQRIIDEAKERGGFCFLAHPIEVAAPPFDDYAYSWQNWDIENYAGLELWNYMSEFKSYLTGRLTAVRAAFNPDRFISGPYPDALELWDNLLIAGKRTRIIGGADAHGTTYSMGPLKRVIFPYDFLFQCVNTHIVTDQAMTGDFQHDKMLVLRAIREGASYVGYSRPAPARGFRFSAQGHQATAIMGGRIRLGHGVTLQFVTPKVADMRLIKDGKIIAQEIEGTHRTYIARETGAYRVEVHIHYKGKLRGWIFSNPIFVVD
jgi:hypothetical protein